MGKTIICAVGLIIGIAPLHGQIYVNQNATGLNDGTTWTDAYVNLQTALGSAGPGSEVWVAMGIYTPGTATTDTFTLPDAVRVLGGFNGTETLESQRNPTINITTLSGELGASGVADNIEVIVTAFAIGVNAELNGFTVVSAAKNGIRVLAASPELNNLRVLDCGQEQDSGLGFIFGGGINIDFSGGAAVRITDCDFSRNSASAGAAIYMDNGAVAEFLRCSFTENAALLANAGGGGAGYIRNQSDAIFKVCTFKDNLAQDAPGGAIALDTEPSIRISHSVFTGNHTSSEDGFGGGHGGAIAGDAGTDAIIQIHDCIFSNNEADSPSGPSSNFGRGGAIWLIKTRNVEVANCLFFDNTADSIGGAIFSFANQETYTNCTIAHCNAPQAGGAHVDNVSGTGAFSTWRNVIIWNCTHNGANDESKSFEIAPAAASVVLDYCCIDDGAPLDGTVAYGFPTVIDVDPLFANETERAFQLRINSPCIDAANTPPIPVDSLDADLDNVFTEKSPDQQFLRRVFDDPVVPNVNGIPNSGGIPEECGISDMGAFERQTHCESGVQGDYDANGLANGLDIQPFVHCYISGSLGTLPCSCSDINMDGFYTFQDVTCLIDILLMRGWCEVQTNCDIPGGGEGGEGGGEGEGRQMMMQSPGGADSTGEAAAGLGKKTETDATATTPVNEASPPVEVEDPAFNARWNAFVEWLEANWIDQYPEMTEEAWNEMATQKMIEIVYEGVSPW